MYICMYGYSFNILFFILCICNSISDTYLHTYVYKNTMHMFNNAHISSLICHMMHIHRMTRPEKTGMISISFPLCVIQNLLVLLNFLGISASMIIFCTYMLGKRLKIRINFTCR